MAKVEVWIPSSDAALFFLILFLLIFLFFSPFLFLLLFSDVRCRTHQNQPHSIIKKKLGRRRSIRGGFNFFEEHGERGIHQPVSRQVERAATPDSDWASAASAPRIPRDPGDLVLVSPPR